MSSGPWNAVVGAVLALAAVLLAVVTVLNGFAAFGEGAAVTWRWPLPPVALAAAIATLFPEARRIGAVLLLLDAAVMAGTELSRLTTAVAAARTTAEGPVPAAAAADLVHGPQNLLVGASLVACAVPLLVLGRGRRAASVGTPADVPPGVPPALLGAGAAVAVALLLACSAPAELLLTLRGMEVSALPDGPPDAEATRSSVAGGRTGTLVLALGAVPMLVSAVLWALVGREARRRPRVLLALGGLLACWGVLVASWFALDAVRLVPDLPEALAAVWTGPFGDSTREPALWTGLLMLLLVPAVAAWPADPRRRPVRSGPLSRRTRGPEAPGRRPVPRRGSRRWGPRPRPGSPATS